MKCMHSNDLRSLPQGRLISVQLCLVWWHEGDCALSRQASGFAFAKCPGCEAPEKKSQPFPERPVLLLNRPLFQRRSSYSAAFQVPDDCVGDWDPGGRLQALPPGYGVDLEDHDPTIPSREQVDSGDLRFDRPGGGSG